MPNQFCNTVQSAVPPSTISIMGNI